MKYQELYESISNPLDKPTVIDDVLEAYLEHYHLYNGLIKNHYNKNKDKKVTGKYYISIRDQLYTYLFEEWSKTILFLTKNVNYSKYQKACILAPYLKDKHPTTYEEVMNVLNGENTTPTIQRLLDELRWDSLGSKSTWNHIDSRYVYAKTHKRNDISHRLYINCDSLLVDFLSLEFMKRCKERKLKFYFKYDNYGERDDTFVVYSDTKSLPAYVEILEEIKKEYGLDNHIYEPAMLTGTINGWIGYGSEPLVTNNERYSFNTWREKHLTDCIKQEAVNWIRNNAGTQILADGKRMPYKLILNLMKTHLRKMLDFFEGKQEQFPRTEDSTISSVEMPFRGSKIYFNKFDVEEIFKKQVELLAKYYPPFKKGLKERIQRTSYRYGISGNYAIDTYAEQLLREEINKEKKQESNSYPKVKRRVWIPMTDEEIEESRRKLGFK